MRRRLDVEMVRRGLAATRSEARHAIRSGRVAVRGSLATKPGTLVAPDEPVTATEPGRPYASRGGEKLAAALDRFGLDPRGRRCLDAGAGSGGFTDVLLRRGAAHVTAVDVGYGQFDWGLRNDRRVTLFERRNVRGLRPRDVVEPPSLLTADLSFISLSAALPALARVAASGADFVLLVKPQFEAGRERVGRRGVVSDPEAWRDAVERVAGACHEVRAGPLAVAVSPLLGPAGNVEFFLHAREGDPGLTLDLDAAVEEAAALSRGPRDRVGRRR